MVTRNELAAIIAALNTDFDTPPADTQADSQNIEPHRDPEAHNDAHLDHNRSPEHIDKAS